MTKTNHVTMTFGTTGGGRVNVRVPRARADLNSDQVRAAMSQILGAAAIKARTGAIHSMEKASMQKVTMNEIPL